jgi:heptosyltransferase-2
VRATNWVGDAVMSLPALRAVRERFPGAHIAVLARPWVADLYSRERFADQVILHTAGRGAGDLGGKWRQARQLAGERFDCAILLQNAFEAALIAWLARIPRRIGYNRDGRGLLLTDAIEVPKPDQAPAHEKYYYIELLLRAGIVAERPDCDHILLDGAAEARERGEERFRQEGLDDPVIGVSPGAAFGSAKRWMPERFAETAALVANETGAAVGLFGSGGERALCEEVAGMLAGRAAAVRNFAGETTLAEFIELAAACRLYLTNDSGAMHVASALGVPTVAVFGPTDHLGTSPSGPCCRVVREPVDCSPCKLRECPVDHRCMTRIRPERVASVALELLK